MKQLWVVYGCILCIILYKECNKSDVTEQCKLGYLWSELLNRNIKRVKYVLTHYRKVEDLINYVQESHCL